MVTLRQYYRSFFRLRSVFVGIPFLMPLLYFFESQFTKNPGEFYPPLGDVQKPALLFTFVLLLLTPCLVFFCCSIETRISPIVCALLWGGSVLSVCALILLYVNFVRIVPIKNLNLDVPVSIGYERTDLAREIYPYPKWNDLTMLKDAGPQEEQIQDLWTYRSIVVVRIFLWLFYNLALVFLLSGVCIGVYQFAGENVDIASEEKMPSPDSLGR
jgi:hypothetical protein